MIRHLLFLLMLCLCGLSLAAGLPAKSELENLFESGKYAQFLARARPLSEKGDADAQFLLGKAYALGKGVAKDADKARVFYALAADQNYPRALHNLGVIVLTLDGAPRDALVYFEKALALGLTTPTQSNMALAHAAQCDRDLNQKSCQSAGNIYAGFWEREHKKEALDNAAGFYVKGCLIAGDRANWSDDKRHRDAMALPCQRAREWSEKGAAQGLGRAAYNRATIDLAEARWSDAKKWLELADERGVGRASWMLGRMYEEGKGSKKSDVDALAKFRRGAMLKNEESIEWMIAYWREEVRRASGAAAIRAAMVELDKLEPNPATPNDGHRRLRKLEILTSNVAHMPRMAKKPIRKHFCPDNVGPVPNNVLYFNTKWEIYSASLEGQTSEDMAEKDRAGLASGTVDADGCLTLSPAGLAAVRATMARGKTPVLTWSVQDRLMTLVRNPKGEWVFDVDSAPYRD